MPPSDSMQRSALEKSTGWKCGQSRERNYVGELRKEMKDAEDVATLQELEGDARFLRKRKVEFGDMLGIQKPEEV